MSPKVQRIGVFVIAVVMVVGTLGSFALMILANNNAQMEYEKQAEEQQKALAEQRKQAEALSAKYYPVFKEYKSAPAPFDASAVGDTVTHTDLVEGTGETVTKNSSYKAYYIGWNPKGEEFDSSFQGESLKPPLNIGEMTLIPGWYDGTDGMKVGGVREITIPSDLAYGEIGSGDKIPPNTPIKFIIMVAEQS